MEKVGVMRKNTMEKGYWLPNSGTRTSKRLIVRHCGNAHPHICDYFVREHGFSDLCRLPYDSGSKSKAAHFKDLVVDLIYALRNLKRIRAARETIAFGAMAFNIALLLKLGLLPACQRVYWFGLFIHSPRWIRRLRGAFRILDSARIQYVLFSNFEKALYAKSLSLNENRMFHVPYGDLSEEKIPVDAGVSIVKELGEDEFFFSGGYSNRDYPSLIQTFQNLPYKLVIICASLNTEVEESLVPPHMQVLRDVPSESFDAYVKASKACIIPIANDTGAAGQSCLLRYMKNRKIIIATDTGIIREYITDGVSGILVKNNHEAMAMAVREVEANVGNYRRYADAAYELYVQYFSGDAIKRRLDQMINQRVEDDGDRYRQPAAML
jgi:glycosyltransferase involved in cell wall biosynthesis